MSKSTQQSPKVVYSELYSSYICIYVDPRTGNWTIQKNLSQEEAEELKEKHSKPLLWYMEG